MAKQREVIRSRKLKDRQSNGKTMGLKEPRSHIQIHFFYFLFFIYIVPTWIFVYNRSVYLYAYYIVYHFKEVIRSHKVKNDRHYKYNARNEKKTKNDLKKHYTDN